jgi:polysaccharide biosynthesis/export protein VpsN
MARILTGLLLILALGGGTAALAPIAYAQAGVDEHSYPLGTGDLIRIQVHGEDDLTLETRITSTGIIRYPFIGDIQAKGRTAAQLQEQITAGLRGDYLVDPKVSVSILDYRMFYINGEVKKPGGFPFRPGLTVHKAITLAGGLTERASTRKIYIVPEHAPDSKKQVGMNTPVAPGDIVTIEQSFF